MNLNEECLLQFLKNDMIARTVSHNDSSPDPTLEDTLSGNLKRILRRNHYVSFPQAIVIGRPNPL